MDYAIVSSRTAFPGQPLNFTSPRDDNASTEGDSPRPTSGFPRGNFYGVFQNERNCAPAL